MSPIAVSFTPTNRFIDQEVAYAQRLRPEDKTNLPSKMP
jgi:hypothetical protein